MAATRQEDGWTIDLHPALKEQIPHYDRVRPLLVHAERNIIQMKKNIQVSMESLYELEEAVSIMKQIKEENIQYFDNLGIVLNTKEYGSTYFTL